MRQPPPAHRACPRARPWFWWLVIALLALPALVVCEAASSPDPAPATPAPVVAAHCAGDLGHDALCSSGAVVTVGPSTRGGRDVGDRDELGLLLTPNVAAVLGGFGAELAARLRRIAGSPSWASQRLVSGRRQLVAIGIARI